MSRVEKHRKYREEAAASISSNQKSVDNFKREPNVNTNSGAKSNAEKIEAIDFSKPIRRLNETRAINRANKPEPMGTPYGFEKDTVKPNINIDQLRERSRNHSENELFDIDTAFDQLKKEHASPEMDTQLEVMNNLFSDKLTEYNSTMQLQTPANVSGRQVMIDEEKLMDLLEEREQRLKNELLTKEKEQQRKVMIEEEKGRKVREKIEKAEQARLGKTQAKFEKEQAKYAKEQQAAPANMLVPAPQTMAPRNQALPQEVLAEVNGKWAEETQTLKKRMKQHDYEFVNLEKNLRKNNNIIIALILILLGILGYMVYTFITS